MNEEIRKLIDSNEHLEFIEDLNKVKCTLTGHEMIMNKDIIDKYLKGKKFNCARTEHIFKQYDKFLRKTKDNEVYCELTCKFIKFTYKDIYNHINGYNFLRACEKWFKCKESKSEYTPVTTVRKKDLGKYMSMMKELNGENGEESEKDNGEIEIPKEVLSESESVEDNEERMEADDSSEKSNEDESEQEVPIKKRKMIN